MSSILVAFYIGVALGIAWALIQHLIAHFDNKGRK